MDRERESIDAILPINPAFAVYVLTISGLNLQIPLTNANTALKSPPKVIRLPDPSIRVALIFVATVSK